MVFGEKMNEILNFLISHFAFLYNDYGARFIDSRVQGLNAMLVLEMGDLRLRFVRDRSQLFLDFQSSQHPKEDNWFSYDVVRQLITKEVVDSALFDKTKAKFVKENIQEIAKVFSEKNKQATEKTLHKFEKARAKRLFG